MELVLQQMPIVVHSLNIGFLQTLRLFFVTLIGAFPLGLIIAFGSMSQFKPLSYFTKVIVWIVRGTPLMIQLLIIYYFPGLVLGKTIWGGGETGRFMAAAVSFIFNYALIIGPPSYLMPAIFLKSTVAGFRVCRRDRKKQDWCLA